jgi:hypothetical protein
LELEKWIIKPKELKEIIASHYKAKGFIVKDVHAFIRNNELVHIIVDIKEK